MTSRARRGVVGAVAGAALLLVAPACTDEGGAEEFCDRLAEAPDLESVLSQVDAVDPAGAESRLESAAEAFRELEASAPGEIRDDVARVRQGVDIVLDAVRANPGDLPAAREAIERRSDELAGLARAGTTLVDYAADECDIDLTEGSEPAADAEDDVPSQPTSSGTDPDGTDDSVAESDTDGDDSTGADDSTDADDGGSDPADDSTGGG